MLDYLYCRFYFYYLKHYDQKESKLSSIAVITMIIMSLTAGVVITLLHIFAYELIHNSTLVVIVLYFLLTYYNFRNKNLQELKEKYKKSKWNKHIPDKALWLVVTFFLFLGSAITILIFKFIIWEGLVIEKNIGRQWLMQLFQN